MSAQDLKSLAALPHGEAAKALKAAGQWDEHAADGEPRAWRVRLQGMMPVTAVLQIEARSAEEARSKALTQAGCRFTFEWDRDDVEDIEADAVIAT